MKKRVVILGEETDGLIDTGSDLTLISHNFHVQLGSPTLKSDDVILTSIVERNISPLGYFNADLSIDGYVINTNVYVLRGRLCSNILIGMDMLSKVNFSTMGNEFRITSRREDSSYAPKIQHNTSEPKIQIASDKNDILKVRRDETTPYLATNKNHVAKNANKSRLIVDDEKCGSTSENILSNLVNVVNVNEIDLSHISDKEYKDEIKTLIKDYIPRKVKTTDVKMNIVLTDERPVSQHPRRLPFVEQALVEEQINQWLDAGIIKESCSDFAAPIVLVKKKNGTPRLCIDYRRLNKKIIKDRFPLPLIDEVLDKLENASVFSSLDLKNGFFHVNVDSKSTKYTSFISHEGQYEFLKVPFGLSTSPSVFQRFIYNVFKELIRERVVIIYMDDLIIPSHDEEEGLRKLKRVFEVASDYGLELNFRKCQFLKKKIEFLGYIIEDGTIQPSPTKTLAVQNFPQPTTIKHLHSFLGLTSYFRRFIPHYSKIAKPLSDLLRNNSEFKFELEQKQAFDHLKEILSQNPVLHIFQQGAALELHTDASSQGFGAVLLQKSNDGNLHPIQYMSKKTSPQQEKLCSYELEVLAIIEALKKFRNYLLGSKFKIVTDCAAFQRTIDKKELTPKVARWVMLLEEFNYEIIHRAGNRMRHVDALSRNAILVITRSQGEMTAKIITAQEQDEHLKLIKNLIHEGERNDYLVKNDILYKCINGEELIVVPEGMTCEIIKIAHDKGHFSITKTMDVIQKEFYIPQLRKRIENVISNCVKCILANKKMGKQEGFLNPIPKNDRPLETYHIDFIGPLPSTNKKYQYIFSVVDSFTKFTWLYPVKSTTAQAAIDKLKIQQKTFGNPARIITDKGAAFRSKDFEDLCSDENIKHVLITSGVPRGNGQVERIHRTIIPVLTKMSIDDPEKWFKHVDGLQRVLNSVTSRSTKWTPFELLTGIKMKTKDDITIKELLDEESKSYFMENRETIREEAKHNILRIQEENKKTYNKKRKKSHQYKLGDLVAIKRTQFGPGLKLHPNFLGPYKVIEVKKNDRYDVKKIGQHEGPISTSTAADYMKPWSENLV